jgi:hypothetical protein
MSCLISDPWMSLARTRAHLLEFCLKLLKAIIKPSYHFWAACGDRSLIQA